MFGSSSQFQNRANSSLNLITYWKNCMQFGECRRPFQFVWLVRKIEKKWKLRIYLHWIGTKWWLVGYLVGKGDKPPERDKHLTRTILERETYQETYQNQVGFQEMGPSSRILRAQPFPWSELDQRTNRK